MTHSVVKVAGLADRIRGCLLAGAVGDALGAVVEFDTWLAITELYGPAGVTGMVPPGCFTDDTQMVLFTCEGLIRASVSARSGGVADPAPIVHRALLRWLHTQDRRDDRPSGPPEPHVDDGWLVQDPRLHRRQAPGTTCLSALATGRIGTVDEPLNHSSGCGGVMRAAPAGLFHPGEPGEAFCLGCDLAAITHGHPDGWQPAGALAAMIASITTGVSIAGAALAALEFVTGRTARLLEAAVSHAEAGLPGAEDIERWFGGGWVGDEALAIAVCCALAAPDLASGVLAAVNHSGDTDSTGAICGNLLGAASGPQAIPADWLDHLDARDLIETMATDMIAEIIDPPTVKGAGDLASDWAQRYPPR
jgi:ADP-ribosyl-[dinitrogen reductase] hydrolase